jgi:beta-lactamase regulating signal transducer with metallopeptidase domain
MVVVTPELVTIVVSSAAALLVVVVKKVRCFVRRVNNRWSYGMGFTDSKLIPEFQGGRRSPQLSGVSSDSSSSSTWRRAISPLTGKLTSAK